MQSLNKYCHFIGCGSCIFGRSDSYFISNFKAFHKEVRYESFKHRMKYFSLFKIVLVKLYRLCSKCFLQNSFRV